MDKRINGHDVPLNRVLSQGIQFHYSFYKISVLNLRRQGFFKTTNQNKKSDPSEINFEISRSTGKPFKEFLGWQ